jgi:hypothetical protein
LCDAALRGQRPNKEQQMQAYIPEAIYASKNWTAHAVLPS